MRYTLYGDGIHDDTDAIQEMIDSSCEAVLPAPKAFYLISRTLVLHSNFRLVLPRFAEIRLAPQSNCLMLKSATVDDASDRGGFKIFDYLNRYDPDAPTENIEVTGGIWNFNNQEQNPNPLSTGKYEPEGYLGLMFLFYHVKNLRISSMTLKNPANFCITLDKVSYFNVEDLTFDFNDGNLYQSNMDGVHICGNCHHGNIEKLFGTCYDDIVALNAEEGSRGPVSDIAIRGIYTEGSYSAVRLLTANPECPIRNIHISDIRGTFYHFVIGFMQYYKTEKRGRIENVTIDNVYASKSDRTVIKFPKVTKYKRYGVLDFEGKIDVKNVHIFDLHRREFVDNIPTILVGTGVAIDNMILENITSENHTDLGEMPLIRIQTERIANIVGRELYEDGKKAEL